AFWACLVAPSERPAGAAYITVPFDRTRDVDLM
ncbi:MAG: hypothetical protein QOK44_5167, partial [Betaproteobacteria bacterium]|nr:hypothetical protein [Betaproteobacteria bacterium]